MLLVAFIPIVSPASWLRFFSAEPRGTSSRRVPAVMMEPSARMRNLFPAASAEMYGV